MNTGEKTGGSGLLLSGAVSNLSVSFMTGAFTRLWESWGWEKVVPSYDKLYYLKQGDFTIEIDGVRYDGRPGQMFLLPYNSVQTYNAYGNPEASKYWIHFVAPCGDKDLMEVISLPPYIEVDDPELVDGLFEKILSLGTLGSSTDFESLLLQKSYIFQLLAYYTKRSSVEAYTFFKDERFAAVLSYMDAHMAEDITIPELAEMTHFNPNYFIKYFKKLTGVSPMDYLLDCRINRAKRLLQMKKMTMKEISSQVGFRTPYYFSRTFKKRTGFTPTVYRATALAKPEN